MKKWWIAIVIIAIAVLIASFVFKDIKQDSGNEGSLKQGSYPENQSEGKPSEEPLIPSKTAPPGAKEFNMPDRFKKEFVKDVDIMQCQTRTYFSDEEISEIIEWYSTNLEGIEASKNIFAAEDKPNVIIGNLIFKKGDLGIYVNVQPAESIPVATGKNMIIYAECSWDLLSNIVGEVSGELTGKEDISWDDALVFEDSMGDFWKGDGSPPSIINYTAGDMIKVYIKNDDEYFYIKYEVAGEIPTLPHNFDGNKVQILTYFTLIDKDKNANTGIKVGYKGADLALDIWFGSPEKAEGKMYSFVQHSVYDAAGEEELSKPINDGVLIAGGVGSKFVASKFRLSDIGLKKGGSINIFPIIEAESNKYHHFSRDVYQTDVTWTAYEIK